MARKEPLKHDVSGLGLVTAITNGTVIKAQVGVEVCVLAAGSETDAGRALDENHEVCIARRVSEVENKLSCL